ncbi:hypothetical protein HNP72_002667 [Sphingobacterium soli]|nr:hypothetical protein [Sphingobacterium soli]
MLDKRGWLYIIKQNPCHFARNKDSMELIEEMLFPKAN